MKQVHPLSGQQVGSIAESEIRAGGSSGRVGHFGWTRTNPDGTPKMHKGIDLLATEGNPVYAAHNGRVRKVGWESPIDKTKGYGQRVYLDGGVSGYETRYAHLSSIDVTLGQLVRAGQRIGAVGRTGNVGATTPTHLHFEVWFQDEPLDPALWLVEEETIA